MGMFIVQISVIGGGVIAELEQLENKTEIMKRTGLLKGIENIKQVQEGFEKLMKEDRRLEHEVKAGYGLYIVKVKRKKEISSK